MDQKLLFFIRYIERMEWQQKTKGDKTEWNSISTVITLTVLSWGMKDLNMASK